MHTVGGVCPGGETCLALEHGRHEAHAGAWAPRGRASELCPPHHPRPTPSLHTTQATRPRSRAASRRSRRTRLGHGGPVLAAPRKGLHSPSVARSLSHLARSLSAPAGPKPSRRCRAPAAAMRRLGRCGRGPTPRRAPGGYGCAMSAKKDDERRAAGPSEIRACEQGSGRGRCSAAVSASTVTINRQVRAVSLPGPTHDARLPSARHPLSRMQGRRRVAPRGAATSHVSSSAWGLPVALV